MLLTEPEIKQVLEQVKVAFPNLTDWEYNNEKNDEYFGFSVWGQLVVNPEELMPRRFFITLDTYESKAPYSCQNSFNCAKSFPDN